MIEAQSGQVITTLTNFPKLNFKFDDDLTYVTVWRVGDTGYINPSGRFHACVRTYTFPASNAYVIIAKLLKFRLLDQQTAIKLKI